MKHSMQKSSQIKQNKQFSKTHSDQWSELVPWVISLKMFKNFFYHDQGSPPKELLYICVDPFFLCVDLPLLPDLGMWSSWSSPKPADGVKWGMSRNWDSGAFTISWYHSVELGEKLPSISAFLGLLDLWGKDWKVRGSGWCQWFLQAKVNPHTIAPSILLWT